MHSIFSGSNVNVARATLLVLGLYSCVFSLHVVLGLYSCVFSLHVLQSKWSSYDCMVKVLKCVKLVLFQNCVNNLTWIVAQIQYLILSEIQKKSAIYEVFRQALKRQCRHVFVMSSWMHQQICMFSNEVKTGVI